MKKNELRAGDVILFPPHKGDFIAQAIAFLTDGEVNHAALCYPDDKGELKIAESILKDGLVLDPFAEHIEEEYPLRICRMNGISDMTPVLDSAKKYLEEKNAYPNFNLGLLGLLLVFKKFSPHTWQNAIVYKFCVIVSQKLMELVRNIRHHNEHPMSCSQFVAQCFTDAGPAYDLDFDKLVINFNNTNNTITRAENNSQMSAIDILGNANDNDLCCNELNDASSESEDDMYILSNFIQVIKEQEHNAILTTRCPNQTNNLNNISLNKINAVTINIINSLYEIIQGYPAKNAKEAMIFLQSSTARNYFVSPQDILINCPKSLTHIGNLSY